jgi:SET domain-containing protein 6
MDELSELEGSMVVGKIGKEEAENDWVSEVIPLVEKFPSIFGSKALYSLELFHHMGSLVLSRSFHVESGEENEDSEDDDDEEEEVESIGDIAMVPLADLLNALSTTSNARLFYSPLALEMRSTAPIAAGEQIFNTYANPPNSDLLRRYGHVDEVNEHDLVEIGLEKVVDLVGGQMGLDEVERESRAEWLLDMGIDECAQFFVCWVVLTHRQLACDDSTFSITTSHAIPEELISTIRAFTASPTEFVKYQTKESPPRGKMDAEVSQWATKLLLQREEEYKTTIEVRTEIHGHHLKMLNGEALEHRRMNCFYNPNRPQCCVRVTGWRYLYD